jgi:hypothetical protein
MHMQPLMVEPAQHWPWGHAPKCGYSPEGMSVVSSLTVAQGVRSRVQVTLVNKDLKEGLVNMASVQAAIPVVHRKEDIESVVKMGGAAADAIVMLGGMQGIADLDAFCSAVLRVLKPGGRCGHPCVDTCTCSFFHAWHISSGLGVGWSLAVCFRFAVCFTVGVWLVRSGACSVLLSGMCMNVWHVYVCLCAPCVGLGLLVRLRFASRSPAMWRVCAIALSFVSGWRAFSSVSLCKYIYRLIHKYVRLRCAVSPSPWLRMFRPVSRPVCGFGVSGSASLCVA